MTNNSIALEYALLKFHSLKRLMINFGKTNRWLYQKDRRSDFIRTKTQEKY